jgi:cell shape-determining protein MreC
MIRSFIKWFVSPSQKPIEETNNVYDKLLELEARVERLEEENVALTNELYRMENSLDARIDILNENPWKEQFDV